MPDQYLHSKIARKKYELATEDFDVKSSTVPYTDRKDCEQEGTAPHGALIQDENSGEFCQNGIDCKRELLLVATLPRFCQSAYPIDHP